MFFVNIFVQLWLETLSTSLHVLSVIHLSKSQNTINTVEDEFDSFSKFS